MKIARKANDEQNSTSSLMLTRIATIDSRTATYVYARIDTYKYEHTHKLEEYFGHEDCEKG